jgi:hypothetical protein
VWNRAGTSLDAGYDYQPCRQVLIERGMVGQIATRGVPAPVQVGRRWVIEQTHAWGNQYGKLRWCTERRRLASAFREVWGGCRLVAQGALSSRKNAAV